MEKKLDFFERAKRLEEIPLLKEQFEESKKEDREWFEQQKTRKIEQSRRDHAIALQMKHRFERMASAAALYVRPRGSAFLSELTLFITST